METPHFDSGHTCRRQELSAPSPRVIAQHPGDQLDGLGIGVFIAARQLLGRGRDPLQQSTVGAGRGPGLSGRGVHLPLCGVARGQIAQFLRQVPGLLSQRRDQAADQLDIDLPRDSASAAAPASSTSSI